MCCGRFRRIVGMSKSDVDDVSTIMTPGVALQGRKPGRKYFSSLHLTRWTNHAVPKTCFILALYRMITSSAVLLKSQRVFFRDSCPFCHRFELCSRVNSLRYRRIFKIERVSCVFPGPASVSKEPVLDASCRLHDGRLHGSQRKCGKWEKVNSAQYHRMLTRSPATTCIGFRASEGQLKVRRRIFKCGG